MLRLAIVISALVASTLSAADSYRPLGLGLGDNVYADAWKASVADLATKGYVPVEPDPFIAVVTKPEDLPTLWSASVISRVNPQLETKGLKPLPFPEMFTAVAEANPKRAGPIQSVTSDMAELHFGNLPRRNITTDTAGQKSLIAHYRMSTGEVTTIIANLAVTNQGPEAKDPAAIVVAMAQGLSTLYSGTYTIAVESPSGRTKRDKQDKDSAELAVKEAAISAADRRIVTIANEDKKAPIQGSVEIERWTTGVFRLRLIVSAFNKGLPYDQRRALDGKFTKEVEKLVLEESQRQAAAAKPKGSTEGF